MNARNALRESGTEMMLLRKLHKMEHKGLSRTSTLIAALLMCMLLLASSVTPASAAPASAGTAAYSVVSAAQPTAVGGTVPMVATRPGWRFGQYDVMLDRYETERAAKSWWAGSVLCWNAGLAWNPAIYGSCLALLTVCAARAYVTGQRAGMTVTIWNTGWCWKY